LIRANNVKIFGFTIRNASGLYAGVCLLNVRDCFVSNNVIYNNYYGVSLSNSGYNNVTNNTVFNNHVGLSIVGGVYSYNTIANNTIVNNRYGIDMMYEDNCLIFGNVITNNVFGIRLSSSQDNKIYNNYFNNTYNAYDDGNNVWNVTKTPGKNIVGGNYLGGNYWSDYTGRDLDHDGLGDTELPYNCSGNITGGDWHPLVLSIRGDFNGNGYIDVGDVSYVAEIVVGKLPQNLEADFNGNGRVDIGDLVKIAYYLLEKIDEL